MVPDNLLIPAVAFVGVEEFAIDVDMAMRVGGTSCLPRTGCDHQKSTLGVHFSRDTVLLSLL